MEDEGVVSHQTFLVKDLPFHHLRKQDIGALAFKWVNLITDRRLIAGPGFKTASWTFVKKIVMNQIILRMNSTFGAIGKATTTD